MEAGFRPVKRFGNPASNAKLKGDLTMRFMMLVKHAESSGAPPKEIVGGIAIFDLKSKEEAVEGALRFMELHKKHWPGWEGETEIRQMYGPEDFGPKT